MSNFDKDKLVLQLPSQAPIQPETKLKLKRVNTITGTTINLLKDRQNKIGNNLDEQSENELSSSLNDHDDQRNNNDDQDKYSCNIWLINNEQKAYYMKQFELLHHKCLTTNVSDNESIINGNVAKIYFEKSGLSASDLSKIWQLSDIDMDGCLTFAEFSIAMHLIVLRRNHIDIPKCLPLQLQNSYHDLISYQRNLNLNHINKRSQPLTTRSHSNENQQQSLHEMYSNSLKLCINHNCTYNSNDNHYDNSDKSATTICQRRNSHNWTKFNDDDDLLNNNNENNTKINDTPKSSSTSPVKLANFDFNDINDVISSNINIHHPVPLRISSSSQSSTSSPTIIMDLLENQQKQSNTNEMNNINKQSFNHQSLRSSFKLLNQNNSHNKMKQIMEHVRSIESRYEQYQQQQQQASDNENHIAAIKNTSTRGSMNELEQINCLLNESNQTFKSMNQDLLNDLSKMLNIVNYLIKQQQQHKSKS